MRAPLHLTAAISGLFHLTSAAASSVLTSSDLHTSLRALQSRQSLSNVSIDLVSLALAIAMSLAILLLIPPSVAFFSELFRRIGARGAYDRVDSSEYDYYYDDDSGYSQRR